MSSNEIAVVYTVGEEKIRLTPSIVKEYLANGADITLPEFKMFTSLCKARGLNPFLKEAYIIKFGSNPAQIVVGKDAILKRAILNKDFDGREQGVIVINDNGDTIEKNGSFVLSSETLVGGWAKAYRKNWTHPVYITVSLSEVGQKKNNGDLNYNWSKQTATMLEKVALIRSLREAFVDDLGGMYDADEYSNENQDSISEIIDQPEPVVEAEIIHDDSSDTEEINNKPDSTLNMQDL